MVAQASTVANAAAGQAGASAGGGMGLSGLFGGQAFGGGAAGALGAALAPMAVFAAMIPISGMIARALGFGAKEEAKRAELAKWAEESGLNAYKAKVEAISGMDYTSYLDSKQPPVSPYDADLQALRNSNTGDMSYEEDELKTRYQSGAGKKSMDDFYAANPDWYTPTGERIYPEGELGDMDRVADAWFAGGQQGPNPMSGIIKNVLNKEDYPILSREGGT